MRQVDLFSKLIDKMFDDGNLTKAQLLDAFHKANPNSLKENKAQKKIVL